jgi:voltage-gated sodium channel
MNFFTVFEKIKNNNIFETFVISVILISSLSIGFRTFDLEMQKYLQWLTYLDYFVTIFFLVEIIIRIIAEKNILKFFKQGWNIFDFIVVTVSLIPLDNSETVFLARLIRIFRLMRLISFVPQFRILTEALIQSIPRVGYVMLFMFVVFYIYAALGSLMFADIDPLHWGNIALAMLTLFQTATLEGWPDLLYAAFEVYPWSWLFFVSFIIINSLIFMNMIIGVIIDVIVRSNDDERPDNIKLLEEINSKLDELNKKS